MRSACLFLCLVGIDFEDLRYTEGGDGTAARMIGNCACINSFLKYSKNKGSRRLTNGRTKRTDCSYQLSCDS